MISSTINQLKKQGAQIFDYFAVTLSRSSSRTGFMRYVHNTSWLFAGKALNMIISFLVGAYVARFLGPQYYGLLTYAASFSGLFAAFSHLGLSNILTRELITHPEERDQLLGTSFSLRIFGSIGALIIITLAILVTQPEPLTALLIFILASAFLLNTFGVIDSYFQAKVLSRNTVIAQNIALVSISVIKLIFILLKLSVIYFAIANILYTIIYVLGLIYTYKKLNENIFNWKWNAPLARTLIKNSYPLMLCAFVATAYFATGPIIIKHLLGDTAAGFYAVAARLSDVWQTIPALICASVFPAFMNARSLDTQLYWHRLKSLQKLLGTLALSIAVIMFFITPFILRILFGTAYDGAIETARIYIWSIIPLFIFSSLSQYLIAENKVMLSLIGYTSGAILNLLLMLTLIPVFGLTGAASALVISSLSMVVCTWYLSRNIHEHRN